MDPDETELLGVLSGSKLFAYGSMVGIGRRRKSTLDVMLDTLSHPKATIGTFVNSFFRETVKIPFAITYGDTNQFLFGGHFSGNQCTSMCLAAIAWWAIEGDFGSFTARDVSLVLRCGQSLHTALRTDYHLSGDEDGRIAIDDMPPELGIGLFGCWTLLSRAADASWVLTSPYKHGEGLITLQAYLQSRLDENNHTPEGYLLTIGQASNTILYTCHGKFMWFDSHGHMRVGSKRCKDFGAVVELETLDHLAMFVIALRGPGQFIQIVPITCVAEGEPVCPSSRDPSVSVSAQFTEEDDLRVTETTESEGSSKEAGTRTVSLSTCGDENDDGSPYAALMGGFGFD